MLVLRRKGLHKLLHAKQIEGIKNMQIFSTNLKKIFRSASHYAHNLPPLPPSSQSLSHWHRSAPMPEEMGTRKSLICIFEENTALWSLKLPGFVVRFGRSEDGCIGCPRLPCPLGVFWGWMYMVLGKGRAKSKNLRVFSLIFYHFEIWNQDIK